jgi:hypothetical protein
LTALYPRLLGSSWQHVAEPVRFAHATGSTVHAQGCLRIVHGRSRGARLLAWVLRLPRASDAADTRLVVTSRGAGEHWLRTFDGRRLDTRQYQAGDRVLAERFGILELLFHVEPSDGGGISYRQIGAALVLGPLRVPLPAAWSPVVNACEEPAGAREIRLEVSVAVPLVGRVLTYEGQIAFEETRA